MEQLGEMRSVLRRSPLGTPELIKEARDLEVALKAVDTKLNGDAVKEAKYEQTVPTVGGRLRNALFGAMRNTYGITGTQREQAEIAKAEFAELSGEVQQLLEQVRSFGEKLDQAGLPWTPGRAIPDHQ